VTNPNDEKRYIAKTLSGTSKPLTFQEVSIIAKSDPTLIIEWIIPKGYLVIETKETNILPTLQGRNEPVLVVKIKDTLYIYCKSKYDRTTINNILACGISANTYAVNKNNIRVTLPFKNTKVSTDPLYQYVTIEHDGGISTMPDWLKPLRKISSQIPDGISVPIQNNEKVILTNQLNRLKHLNKFEQESTLNIINEEFCANPLTPDDIKSIISTSEEILIRQFFDKDKFLHHKLGDYIIEACNIKRDSISKELFYFNDKKGIYSSEVGYIMGYMTKLCPQLKDYQKQETVKYILNYLYEDAVPFNTNPYSVVFKNGILDLSTNVFEETTPSHLESIQINCSYIQPIQQHKTVDEFFRTATNGNKDTEQLLYEAIGYAMLKTNELQLAFMLVGSGRNGKSTYLDLVKAVLGKGNYGSISFKDLQNNFRASMLINKLASFAGDVSNQPIQDSELVKSIIAGEEVTMEQKYKDAVTQDVFATMFYACNSLPRTPDTSDGFYRRFCIIPFNADLTKVSKVDGMTFKRNLLSPEALDYVAYKAIQAISNVLNNTREFTEPQEVKEMKENYRIDNSTILSWYKENFKNDPTLLSKKKLTEAYLNYANWCEECNRSKMSRTTFESKLQSDIGLVLTN
jgi:putative DNA primase/helicase